MPMTVDQFAQQLDDIARQFESPRLKPELEECIKIGQAAESVIFDSAASPEGSPWPPRKRSYPWPPLVKSGAMKAAAMGGAGSTSYSSDTEAGFGVSHAIPYAPFHQHGTRRMPQRKFLGATAETLSKFRELIAAGGKRLLESV